MADVTKMRERVPSVPKEQEPIDSVFLSASINGLSGRLRGLVGAAVVADELKVPYYTRWRPDRHCAVPYELLFETLPGITEDAEFKQRLIEAKNPLIIPAGPSVWDPEKFHIWSGLSPDAHLTRAAAVLRQLQPVEELRALIRLQQGTWPSGRKMVGVHVRMTDRVFRYGTVKAGHNRFVRAIDQLRKQKSNMMVVLVADNPDSIEYLRGQFPGLCWRSATQWKFEGGRLSSSRDALVDMWLLSMTTCVMGEAGSTFGRTAALLGDIQFMPLPYLPDVATKSKQPLAV